MKIELPVNRKARIEMLPLIDIVFLLLVVFIYAMLSMAVHQGLPVALPTSSSAKIEKKMILSVTVKADGSIYVDKDSVSLENLSRALKSKAHGKANPGVLFFADQTLSYQNLFKVLDEIKRAGLNRISLQAEVEN